MAKLPYHKKQIIFHHFVNVIMSIILVITLFPIFWMIYNSFMSNQDISLGRIIISSAPHHTILSKQIDDSNLLVGTSDGSLNIYNLKKRKVVWRKTFNTFATAMELSDETIFLSSGDKGIFSYNLSNKKVKHAMLPLADHCKETLFVNKIAGSILAVDQAKQRLWVSIGYNDFGTVFELDSADLSVKRTYDIRSLFPFSYEKVAISSMSSDNNYLYIGSNKGVVVADISAGKILGAYGDDILRGKSVEYLRHVNDNTLALATDDNLYFFNTQTRELTYVLTTKKPEYLRLITALRIDRGEIYIGTNTGFLIVDNSGKVIRDIDAPVFKEVDQFGVPLSDSKLVEDEIINFSFTNSDSIILESLHGRVAIIDGQTGELKQTIMISTKGYRDFRWRNYVDLWNNIDFGLYLRNSFIICGSTMLIAMFLATLTAYALVRFPFPGAKAISVGILATQMIPGVMFLIPIHIMFTNFTKMTGIPIHGTYGGIIFIYSAFFLPFSVWILRGFFAAIPVALEEAATIDGCTPFQVFTKISLPLAIPGVIATGIFVFLVAWDELMFAWILTNAKTMTVPVGIRLFVGNFQNRFDLMMAAATVATIPVMIIFFLLQRYIVSGLTAGAVKE